MMYNHSLIKQFVTQRLTQSKQGVVIVHMASISMIRCTIAKTETITEQKETRSELDLSLDSFLDESNERYIPMTDYNLWKYFITTNHNFRVIKEIISRWINQEEAEKHPDRYEAGSLEPVKRLELTFYSRRRKVRRRVIRFIALKNYEKIKQIIIKNIQEHGMVDTENEPFNVIEEDGYWVNES